MTLSVLKDRHLLAALLAGLLVRVAWLLYTDTRPASDAEAYFDIAEGLASGLGYEWLGRTSAYWPVGYPATLAALFAVFGSEVAVGEVLNLFAGLLAVTLTYLIAHDLYDRRIARTAALLVAVLPSQVFYTSVLLSEPLFTTVQLAVLWLLIRALRISEAAPGVLRQSPTVGAGAVGLGFMLPVGDVLGVSMAGALVALVVLAVVAWRLCHPAMLAWLAVGAATGYALLIRPAALTIVVAAIVVLILLLRRAEPARRRVPIACAVVFMAATFLVVLPWLARNNAEFGVGATLANNGGVNLLVGNHGGANGCWSFDPADAPLVAGPGNELDNDREAGRRALRFIREEPLEAASLIPRKFDCMWRQDSSAVNYWNSFGQEDPPGEVALPLLRITADWYYYGLIVLGVLGVPIWARRTPSHILLPLVVVLTVLYYLVFFGDDRFHQPVLPIMAIWAACGVAVLPAWLRWRPPAPLP
ncbi:MAG: hypothetical protein GEU28_11090 [Dehalococcoidia bacterium]|nr:hypothetical protein [Dehalococcoidia bacterium]